jgi:FAD/FMN-containing dehydrogenase
VEPTTSADVSLIIKALAKSKVKFAVRGGGYTLNPGAANIASAITINLRSINQVTFNTVTKLVSIGGGAKWGEIYPILDTLGLATSGGRVSVVGVGSLSTEDRS